MTSATQRSVNPPTRLLGIWAHPDDEAYLSAGLMARTIESGGAVAVLTITDGECGFPEEDGRPRHSRASQRRSELRSAMSTIGVEDVRFMGVADGAVAAGPTDELVRRVGAVMSDFAPEVVVTFGPDGITGHEDHVANSRLVTQAWLGCRTGELWYAAKTEQWLEEWRELHDEFDVWMTEEPTGVCDDDVELVVDLDESELDRKRAVLAEHGSQTDGLADAFGEDRYRLWIRQETFRRPTDQELADFERGPVADSDDDRQSPDQIGRLER